MSEKNKTSDQLKRVEAHFADLRLRVQKFKAKLERVNIDNGGRVLTVDQVTMLHDAYGFSWSLYAHTLSLEKEWPTQVLDGTPFPPPSVIPSFFEINWKQSKRAWGCPQN